jgi:hypothetical protein
MKARLCRLLADRPEFMNEDVGARLDMAWTEEPPGSLPLLDRVLMAGSDELDRLCAYVLRHLRERAEAAVLDVVGVLGPERLLAIYVSLSRRRQTAVLRDPVWAYHVGRANLEAIEAAERFWDELPDVPVPDDMPWPEQREYFAFIREADRYRAGLPHELTPEQVEMVNRGGRKSREILANARQEQSP